MVLAHGVGTRADLPVPLSYALIGGRGRRAGVLPGARPAVARAAAARRRRRPAAARPGAGAWLDSPVLTWVLRLVVLALTLLVVAVGLFGPEQPERNLAPYAFYITFWVGLVPASLLLGPVWRRVNPLRTLHAGARARSPARPRQRSACRALGYWPAAGALLVFGWLELAYPERVAAGDGRRCFLVVYGVAAAASRRCGSARSGSRAATASR